MKHSSSQDILLALFSSTTDQLIWDRLKAILSQLFSMYIKSGEFSHFSFYKLEVIVSSSTLGSWHHIPRLGGRYFFQCYFIRDLHCYTLNYPPFSIVSERSS